eukprot:CAMPEP_0172629304 /NCGR_PEP_ID=MMETSP1068-20121228/166914_1 /TAXON_ID=35684 /ORGANISM="Pseudopedinella elastica, Strain CCMP716" /LENGTH=181 /DNA_ID=CAMNT_0013439783 /DNA_START=210 /DNA_END=755 /DNA_ORIENTATION=-
MVLSPSPTTAWLSVKKSHSPPSPWHVSPSAVETKSSIEDVSRNASGYRDTSRRLRSRVVHSSPSRSPSRVPASLLWHSRITTLVSAVVPVSTAVAAVSAADSVFSILMVCAWKWTSTRTDSLGASFSMPSWLTSTPEPTLTGDGIVKRAGSEDLAFPSSGRARFDGEAAAPSDDSSEKRLL